MPATLVDKSVAMRAQSKAVLNTTLQVEQSSRIQGAPDAVVIRVCAMRCTVHRTTSDTVEDYIFHFLGTITYNLERSDVYLICDRYIGNSTKQMTRSSRSGNYAIVEIINSAFARHYSPRKWFAT